MMSNRVPESLRIANVSRRSLLLGMGAGSLVLAIGLPRPGRAQDAVSYTHLTLPTTPYV